MNDDSIGRLAKETTWQRQQLASLRDQIFDKIELLDQIRKGVGCLHEPDARAAMLTGIDKLEAIGGMTAFRKHIEDYALVMEKEKQNTASLQCAGVDLSLNRNGWPYGRS